MANADTRATWEYHDGTKHSPESIRRTAHFLEWDNQPRPYKLYRGLEGLPLPRDLPASGVGALDAIAAPVVDRREPRAPNAATLAAVLHHAAGITKILRSPGGTMPFRAASCTGALYHIELYVVCGDLDGLEAGVYQFGVHDFALRQLRGGDLRGVLAQATGQEPAIAHAPATIVCTSTFWRNSWKYQARAYRHAFWDNGTILANLLAVAAAHQLPARVVMGFVDDEVNLLVDVDGETEAAVSLVPLGSAPAVDLPSAGPAEPLGLETEPLSAREVDYPAIRAMHAASSLDGHEDVARWRATTGPAHPEPVQGRGEFQTSGRPVLQEATTKLDDAPTLSQRERGSWFPLRPPAADDIPATSIETVIRHRGSSRQFSQEPIGFDTLSTMLGVSLGPIDSDFRGPGERALADLYLIVNAVDGLPSGSYVYHRAEGALELLWEGQVRREAGFLDLGQRLGADAAVNAYFLVDLNPILARFGNRGYRAAQMEAAISAGRLYLSAYALGLGATGLTFFDDEVTAFFSPHAAGKSVMFLIALGRPAPRLARA